jgi:hypothetical protein
MSLHAGASGAAPSWRLIDPLFATLLAAAVVLLLAIENVVAPSLRRRWLVAPVVGVLAGFGLGHGLADDWQFAGSHPVAAAISFDAGVALGAVIALGLAFAALRVGFRYALGERAGVVVLSAILGHLGWHWMMEWGHPAAHAVALLSSASTAALAWWLLLGLVVGRTAWFFPPQWGGAPVPPFLSARSREAHARQARDR